MSMNNPYLPPTRLESRAGKDLSKEEMLERGHPVWAEIDLGAIRHNIGVLAKAAPDAEVMGVVKGFGYGHGNIASAEAMLDGGAVRLGVARVAEALHLREAGIGAPIHVFTEPPPEAAGLMIELHLVPAVYTQTFARALSSAACAAGATVPVHLKLDTGMHRVGVITEDVPAVMSELRSLPGIEIEGVWSHFAVADVPGHPFTHKQLDLFSDLVDGIKRWGIEPRFKHMANSAATLSVPQSHFDIVRCGIAAYGLWPGRDLGSPADLRPALAVKARVNMVKTVPGGEGLSYGLKYELDHTARVVTVPAGYADGYDRRLSGRADVLIGGKRYGVSGAVCMDQFMVDVGRDEVEAGATVTLLGRDGGEQITAEELAGHIGTINYEVTTRVPSRVPRLYLNRR
ncbi:MAG: alanine racemase [Actinomycetota bacterium]|nr:alanine racemase [Actinomycetota bacterium]